MSELKYYKLSGKIDLLRFSIVFIIAIIASYLIGFLYLKMSEGFHFFYESIQNSNIQIHNNQIGFLASKLTNPRGIIALIVIVILFIVGPFLPFIISLLLMVGLIHLLREKGKSRNRNIDIISFVLLAFLCFIVSNKYKIDSIWDFIELSIWLVLFYALAQSSTNYFCEKCSKTYKVKKFYSTSELNSDDYLENVIKEGIDDEERFEEKAILEKEDVKNLYYVELNKCDTCGSQIVKIESKIIEVDSDGKKKIKDGNKITEDLLIS